MYRPDKKFDVSELTVAMYILSDGLSSQEDSALTNKLNALKGGGNRKPNSSLPICQSNLRRRQWFEDSAIGMSNPIIIIFYLFIIDFLIARRVMMNM